MVKPTIPYSPSLSPPPKSSLAFLLPLAAILGLLNRGLVKKYSILTMP